MVDKFFIEMEDKLLKQPSIPWSKLGECPEDKGCYMICHIDFPRICYIGESKNLYDRLFRHHRTGNNSSFRKNLYENTTENNFQPKDVVISQFLNECVVKCLPMVYGRKELEEYLIEKYNPIYNREGNKKR